MDIRDEGGFSAAEGCMYSAVVLFALLLIGILVVMFLRFSHPPSDSTPKPAGPPPAAFAPNPYAGARPNV